MIIGYARVSTDDQNLDGQIKCLVESGIDERNIYKEKISGRSSSRPELDKALAFLKEGDTFVVYKLDRLGRSISHLIRVLEELKEKKVKFKSLSENIDTGTSMGMLLFYFIGAFAEFERSIIQERTKLGLEAAALRGRRGGRPRALSDEQIETAKDLRRLGKSLGNIAQILNTSPTTIHRVTH